jgi:hypothetical protein
VLREDVDLCAAQRAETQGNDGDAQSFKEWRAVAFRCVQ